MAPPQARHRGDAMNFIKNVGAFVLYYKILHVFRHSSYAGNGYINNNTKQIYLHITLLITYWSRVIYILINLELRNHKPQTQSTIIITRWGTSFVRIIIHGNSYLYMAPSFWAYPTMLYACSSFYSQHYWHDVKRDVQRGEPSSKLSAACVTAIGILLFWLLHSYNQTCL